MSDTNKLDKCFAEVQAEDCHNEKVSLSYKSLDVSGLIRANNDNMKLTQALNELDTGSSH